MLQGGDKREQESDQLLCAGGLFFPEEDLFGVEGVGQEYLFDLGRLHDIRIIFGQVQRFRRDGPFDDSYALYIAVAESQHGDEPCLQCFHQIGLQDIVGGLQTEHEVGIEEPVDRHSPFLLHVVCSREEQSEGGRELWDGGYIFRDAVSEGVFVGVSHWLERTREYLDFPVVVGIGVEFFVDEPVVLRREGVVVFDPVGNEEDVEEGGLVSPVLVSEGGEQVEFGVEVSVALQYVLAASPNGDDDVGLARSVGSEESDGFEIGFVLPHKDVVFQFSFFRRFEVGCPEIDGYSVPNRENVLDFDKLDKVVNCRFHLFLIL